MGEQVYRKHFVPLESNPHVFNELIHNLGVALEFKFHDIYTLDQPELLPHPALALILIFPTSPEYEEMKAKEEQDCAIYGGCTDEEDVIWFKQTINNACGLYAILHAVCNRPGSVLYDVLEASLPLKPPERALVLENSEQLEDLYKTSATKGDTIAPTNAEDEVDFHYVCFAKSKSLRVYELDGDRIGPVDTSISLSSYEDMLSETPLGIVKDFVANQADRGIGFSLMALVRSDGSS